MAGDLELQQAIERGVEFLVQRQLPNGQLRTLASRSIDLGDPEEDSSIFTTAVVAYSLSFCERAKVRALKEKAITFLLREMHAPGFWSYWASGSSRTISIDIDDTACASLALRANGAPFLPNKRRLLENRDEQGRFLTWLFDERLMSFEKDLPVSQHKNVDPVVNANLLAYLGYHDATRSALEYVIEWIRSDNGFRRLGYYVDRLSLYYAVSRAFYCGVEPFRGVREELRQAISHRLCSGGSWDPLSSALAACTLLNLAFDSEELNDFAYRIIREQRPNGSWREVAMYVGPTRFHGSEELTSALCLEGLERLRIRQASASESLPPRDGDH